MADKNKQKWILTHDSHTLKKGEVYEGETLPAWLLGKVNPLSVDAFEVATPGGADLEKLKADLDAETQRADAAVAAQTKAAEEHAAALATETQRADAAEAALKAATTKAK